MLANAQVAHNELNTRPERTVPTARARARDRVVESTQGQHCTVQLILSFEIDITTLSCTERATVLARVSDIVLVNNAQI